MMTPALIIQKKRDGKELAPNEIHEFIRGLSNGNVADYQATAFLMAVYFKGMTLNETVALTQAMLESGQKYDLSEVPGFKVDKHSTGGVGDKVSLILAPLAAACGLKVPMMAGRGLGHTGGTVDKLESIPGYNANPGSEKFLSILKSVGCVMIGQSESIAPADKKLYALRDVTATVECIPLIVASILSKKIAEGTQALVMDIKVGNGAFMKTQSQARTLAKVLTQVAKKMNLACRATLTDMNQPLGYSVGNTLEIIETIEILRNRTRRFSSGDVKELTIQLCAQMLQMSQTVKSLAEARKLAHQKLASGAAWKKFEEMIVAQGGDLESIRNPNKLPLSTQTVTWRAKRKGYITQMNTEVFGRLLVDMGGGRKKTHESIDHSVGLEFHRKLGARIALGDTLATIYVPPKAEPKAIESWEAWLDNAIVIENTRKKVPKLILEIKSS